MDDSGTKILANYYEIKERAETECKKLEDEEDPLILIGTATCGIASGALEVVKAFKEEMDKSGINARLIQTGCLGHCYAEPLVIIKKFGFPSICYNHINPVTAKSLVRRFLMEDDPCLELVLGALEENEIIPPVSLLPRFYGEKRYILKHCGLIDPCDINQYLVYDGYKSLATALEKAPEEITNEIKDSGLRGRGGAGFPTGRKLEFCVNASTKPKYIICNADEGDPGAFMDRAILESCPHQVLEGIIILAYTVGAEFGFIYIRQEYPLAVEFVEKALHQAKSKGFLGNNILNSNFNFDLKVFKGSGAFVC
ncbi:MAG: NADH-quinone oxidoreductase subunit F, partial [Thermodesulfobacteriota bacterium]|nr:NADH-quinone oxidoreductase subunit F [Thermodesulfobacteriota bacterium]